MEAVAYYSELTLKLYKVRLARRLLLETLSYPCLAEEAIQDSLDALVKVEQELHQKANNVNKQLPSIYFEDESIL